MKLVTPSALVERLKINSSLARAACKFLAEVRLAEFFIDLIRRKSPELSARFFLQHFSVLLHNSRRERLLLLKHTINSASIQGWLLSKFVDSFSLRRFYNDVSTNYACLLITSCFTVYRTLQLSTRKIKCLVDSKAQS